MTVTCGGGGYGCGAVIGTYIDKIEEKYPFWCDVCDEQTNGKYPWTITTEVVECES